MKNFNPLISVLLLVLICFPTVAQAQQIIDFNSTLLVQTKKFYRQPLNRSWQLASLPDSSQASQMVTFNKKIYLVSNDGNQDQLLESFDGLKFVPVDGIAAADSIKLRLVSNQLLIARQ